MRQISPLLVILACVGSGCGLLDYGTSKKTAPAGFIATPPTYYSTSKARYLGTKYKDNLERLAEHITRNSSTAQLQFANNISSVGGIGFFTHSATKTADERFLEVVLATPETFESKGEYSEKVNQLFSRYGKELLGILAGDTQIYQDKELSGYGLNFTWRTMLSGEPANRTTMARAIIYFPKEKVSGFLRRELGQSDLLHDAVIFAVEEDGPLNLVSYQPRETKPDFRPAIREDNLATGTAAAKPLTAPSVNEEAKGPGQKNETKVDVIKKDVASSKDTKARPVANVAPLAEKAEVKAAQKVTPPVLGSAENANPADKASSVKPDTAEKLALAERSGNVPPVTAVPEAKAEPIVTPVRARDRADQIEAKVSAPRLSVPLSKVEGPASGTADVIGPAPSTRASTAQPANAGKQAAANPSADVKAKPAERVRQESAAAPAPSAKLPVSARAGEDGSAARLPSVAKLDETTVIEPAAPVAVASAPKAVETARAAAPAAEEQQPEALPATKLAAPGRPKPLESQPIVEAKTAEKPRMPPSKLEPVAKTPTPTVIPEVAQSIEVRKADLTTQATATGQVSAAAAARNIEPPVSSQAAGAPEAKVPGAPAVRAAPETASVQKIEPPKLETPKMAEVKAPAEPKFVPVKKVAEPALARKIETPAPVSVAKTEPAQTTTPAPISMPAPVPEKAAPEQLALLRKPAEMTMEKKPLARPAPRSLEGFIIQIAFNDKEKAQAWADQMQQRGYAVSLTEAGAEGALRVRLGNFSVRDDAERQLRNFKQEGMNGIIINLPQAFRPEARSSVP